MNKRAEKMKARWANVSAEERSRIMSERRKLGASKQTPEQRSASAKKASWARWGKALLEE